MLLQGVPFKKTVMVLAGIAVSWLDLYGFANWEGYNVMRLMPSDHGESTEWLKDTFGPLALFVGMYPQSVAMTVLSVLLGRHVAERLFLFFIGFTVSIAFWYFGMIVLSGSGAH